MASRLICCHSHIRRKLSNFYFKMFRKKIFLGKKESEILQPIQKTAAYIPTLSHVYFDKINFKGILAKLTEFGLDEKKGILRGI